MSSLTGTIGQVINTGKAYNGTNAEIKDNLQADLAPGIDSQMIYPVKGKDGRIVGVVEITNSNNGIFAADEEFLLKCLTDCLSYTIVELGTEQSFYLELHKHELIEQFLLALQKAHNESEISGLVSLHVDHIFTSKFSQIVYVQGDKLIKYKANETEPIIFSIGNGLCSSSALKKTASLIVHPQCHPNYNGELDIDTNMPLYVFPLFKSE